VKTTWRIIMASSRGRSASVLCLALTLGWPAGRAGAADEPAAARTDLYGVPLPADALARCGTPREQNRGHAGRVPFSPDGRFLASANGTRITLWDVAAGRAVRSFTGHPNPVRALAFAAGGKQLVSFGKYTVRTWDVATGKALRRLAIPIVLRNLDPQGIFSADGRTLAVTDVSNREHLIRLWDVAAEKETVLRGTRAEGLAFSADGKMLITAGAVSAGGKQTPALQTWDVATGKELQRLTDPALGFVGVSVGRDGQAAVTAWDKDEGAGTGGRRGAYVLHLWDLKKQARGRTLVVSLVMPLWPPVCAPDGKAVAVADSPGIIHVCDTATGKETHRLRADGPFPVLSFSPDGKLLACSTAHGGVQLWDAATGKGRSLVETHGGVVTAVAFSHDGKTVASASEDGTVRLWEAATGRPLRQLSLGGGASALAFTSDGRHLLTDSRAYAKGPRLWETATGAERRLPRGKSYLVVGFSADGTTLALSGNARGSPRGFGAAGPRQGLFSSEGDLVGFASDVAFRADLRSFRWVGPAPPSKAAPVDARDGLPPLREPRLMPLSDFFDLSPDGTVLAEVESVLAGRPDTGLGTYWLPSRIRLLHAASGEEIGSLPLQGERSFRSPLAFSPDGRTVAAASAGSRPEDRAVLCLLETAGGKERLRLPGTAGAVAFAPDGRMLASCGEKGIELWDALTGASLGRFDTERNLARAVAFSPDGRTLASGQADGTVLIWDATAAVKRLAKQAAPKAERLDALWADLADADAARAYRAIVALVAAPERSVPFLKGRILVPDAERRVKKLLADLDDDKFRLRQRAGEELEQLAEHARPHLLKALADRPTLEKRRRLEQVLAKLGPPASSRAGSRQRRAVEALERIGTPEAREVLRVLADGPAEGPLTEEAKGALRRLSAVTRGKHGERRG
jgi:WD40 repeat protein